MNDNSESVRKKVIALASGGIDDAYLSSVVQSFINKCEEFDFRVMWFQSLAGEIRDNPYDAGEINIYELINFNRIDALVITAMFMKSEKSMAELIKKAKLKNIPIIIIDGENDCAYSISLEYEKAFGEIVRHVIKEHGAKDIKFLGGAKGNDVSDEREKVFRNVMEECGLSVTEDNIDYGYFWWASGGDAAQKHYDRYGKMPDAFICANDSMAIGVCMKLAELGFRVPEDVIVTGIDGIAEGSTFFPSITTLMCNVAGAGETAAVRLNEIFEGRIPPTGKETVSGKVMFRESCGCEPMNRSATDNVLKHDLYNHIDLWNGFSDSMIKISEAATGCISFEDTLEKIKLFLRDVWSKECWLCICDGFISESVMPADEPSSYNDYLRKGYAPIMKYVIHGLDNSDFEYMDPFASEEMLPDLDGVFERCRNIMFLPLHFQDRCIGYLGMEFNLTGRNFHILYALLTNISNVLENSRVKQEMLMAVNSLEDMYIKDSMTRLYNRRGFYRLTPEIYEKCVSEKTEFMVLSVDMDGLKGINDNYGHHEGDNAIITIANALRAVSDGEIIARFGGDEYIAAGVCKNSTYAEDLVKRFEAYLKNYNENSGKPYLVEASCGIVKGVPESGGTIDQFIRQSDELMYVQKSTRRRYRGYCRSKERNTPPSAPSGNNI